MGLCMSAESAARAARVQAIEKEMQIAQEADMKQKKLLLLGAGESGKSTLFKQMIQIYGDGYTLEQRRAYIPIIHGNIIEAIKMLGKFSSHPDLAGNDEIGDTTPQTDKAQAALKYCLALDDEAEIDEKCCEQILTLWDDKGIQEVYENRNLFQFPDSGAYFFARLTAGIIDDKYTPSDQDILRSRVRTTGIVEQRFTINNSSFNMFDVGGQRNERKKWIHCFEGVTCVIFVGAISEYDQVLFEDESTNRLIEALELFDEICNSRWFKKTSFILFLNKCDLLEMKLKKGKGVDMCEELEYPEELDPCSYADVCEFMEEKFLELNESEDKEVYAHVTCATDTKNVSHVFNSVMDTLLNETLKGGGFM